MKEISLSGISHLVAFVDDEDFDLVRGRTWYPVYARGGWVFAQSGQHPSAVLMHRLIMNVKNKQRVSHRDKNGLNNQRENLRLATHRQSMQSHRKYSNNKSGYKGVYYQGTRSASWCAQITVNGKVVRRYRHSAIEAAQVYDELARQYFGEFAVVNFP